MTTPPSSNTSPVYRILDAAAAVFAERGFDGARVDVIAARAGVNKAMLYYHVGDKSELYAAVLTRNLTRAHAAVAKAVERPETPAARLGAIVAAIVTLVDELPTHPRIMLREIASGAAHLPDRVVAEMVKLFALVQQVLEDGAGRGEFRPLDPFLTHLMILGTVSFMTATRPIRERLRALGAAVTDPEPPAALAAYLSDVILNGIVAPKGQS